MKIPTIHTIDAREHVYLEGMSKHYNWTTAQSYMQINLLATATVDVLARKNVSYAALKNALIPRANRKEIAFVFDSRNGLSDCYGRDVFKVLIPLLDRKASTSILCGDYIGDYRYRDLYKTVFFKNITAHKEINYRSPELFYIVYLNNLSELQFQAIHRGLLKLEAYVGYFDLTFSSSIKTILSSMLVKTYLKSQATIINATEADEDINMLGYPFEKHGYRVIGIDELTYGLFLSYKIEREVLPGYETDTGFSINAITEDVQGLSDLDFIVQESRLEYLFREKFGTIERAGLTNITADELSILIQKKLSKNYIFSMTFKPEFQTMNFSTLIEVPRIDSDKPMKLTAGLKYLPSKKSVELLTLF